MPVWVSPGFLSQSLKLWLLIGDSKLPAGLYVSVNVFFDLIFPATCPGRTCPCRMTAGIFSRSQMTLKGQAVWPKIEWTFQFLQPELFQIFTLPPLHRSKCLWSYTIRFISPLCPSWVCRKGRLSSQYCHIRFDFFPSAKLKVSIKLTIPPSAELL